VKIVNRLKEVVMQMHLAEAWSFLWH